ncbi:MAG: TIGR03790 family protein [Thermoplasmata archaeon]
MRCAPILAFPLALLISVTPPVPAGADDVASSGMALNMEADGGAPAISCASVNFLPPFPRQSGDEMNYSDVLLLINNQSSLSVEIGRYFKEKRQIPDTNICNISMPTTETISFSQFSAIRSEVERFIIERGLNDSLNYIVTTKGVPHRVSGAAEYYASFDDEISLILGPYAGYIGGNYWFTNPFYGSEQRFSRKTFGVFITTRLIGYDLTDCLRLVDNALNSTGARGTFVLDMNPNKDGSGYQAGNDWCREANRTLTRRGYNVILESTSLYLQNLRDVAGYASWGSNDGNAPNNAITNFTWVPGAVGTTYVSTSARSFSYPPSYGQSLIADNIREGITGIHGNVYEPYLTACARPHILLERYTRGWNLAESFSASMATSSWQNCIVGDPKIRPYADNPDPSILPENLTIEPARVVEGTVVNISAVVTNEGGSDALNTSISFYLGNPASGGTRLGPDVTIERLGPGGRAEVRMPWNTAGHAGIRKIYVRLTPSKDRPQLWEGNDEASTEVLVLGRPELVLRPESLKVSDLSPIEGVQVRVEVMVANAGESEAETLLELLTDGVSDASRPLKLGGKEFSTESFLWNSTGRAGARRLTLRAAPVELEANLSNNELSIWLFVRVFGFELRTSASALSCAPGGSAVLNLTLESFSNTPETVVFRVSGLPHFWECALEPDSATLEPGSTINCTMTISLPPGALVSESCELAVIAEGVTSGLRRGVSVSLNVTQIHSLRVVCESPEGAAAPGEVFSFNFKIYNLGNGPDRVSVMCEAPAGWITELERETLELPHACATELRLQVAPPQRALAGDVGVVDIIAVAGDGSRFSTTVEVEVIRVTGLDASLSEKRIALELGETSEVTVEISNTGNGVERVSLTVSQSGLLVELLPPELELEPYSSSRATLRVRAPVRFSETTTDLQIYTTSGSGISLVLELVVDILRPDIKVVNGSVVVTPPSPVEGSEVCISLRLANHGPGHSGRVTLTLIERGAVLTCTIVEELSPGEETQAVLRWTPRAGHHELQLLAEPERMELNLQDNRVDFSLTVTQRPVPPQPPTTECPSCGLVIAGASMAIIAAAAMALFILRRRGREGGGEG